MLCILQARMSSKRLPGKVLKIIGEQILLECVISRLSLSKKISKIVIATSNKKSDKKIINFCKSKNLDFKVGSLNDVASRFIGVIKKSKSKYFIRISADSPLIDPFLIDKMINQSKKSDFDIFTNVFPRTFPKGQSIEIISSKTFLSNYKYFKKIDKEHITRYFYKHYKNFKIINYRNYKNLSNINMCIDKRKDLKKFENFFLKYSFSRLLKKKYQYLVKIF